MRWDHRVRKVMLVRRDLQAPRAIPEPKVMSALKARPVLKVSQVLRELSDLKEQLVRWGHKVCKDQLDLRGHKGFEVRARSIRFPRVVRSEA